MRNLKGIEWRFTLPIPKFTTPIYRTSQENIRPERVASDFVNGTCVAIITFQILIN